MSAKPFRNSKGVNKPFRSPFNTPRQSKNNKDDTKISEQNKRETSLKVTVAKKLFFQQTLSPKKLRLSKENESNEKDIELRQKLYRSDLESLKHRMKQKEKTIQNLKTTILYRKKNKAEDLESAIEMWTNSCQNALRDYQNNLQNANDLFVAMSTILVSFNINPDTVRFSVENDTFY